MPVKQSFCYPAFTPETLSLDELFATAADIGYKAMEMWKRPEDFKDVVAAAHRNNLVVASMNGHHGIADGSNNRANQDRIAKELRLSIDIAADNGIGGVICLAGVRQPFVTEVEAVDACADCYRRVIEHAEAKGVNLNLELLNSKLNHPGYQCDHTAWGLAVVQKVASPRMKLLYDIYHMQIMEGDLIRTIQANIQHIGHFHTAGVPGRSDPDHTQEINYPAVCKAIAATDYAYYLGHEFFSKGDKIEALRKAFAICNA